MHFCHLIMSCVMALIIAVVSPGFVAWHQRGCSGTCFVKLTLLFRNNKDLVLLFSV